MSTIQKPRSKKRSAAAPSRTVSAGAVSPDAARIRHRAEDLIRQYDEYLCGLARRLCRGRLDPDDLVHDLIEKMLRSPDAIPEGANEPAWMARALRNLFIDKLRRLSGRHEVRLASTAVTAPADDRAWWEAITPQEVHDQLARIPGEQRTTFELFAFEGMSYDAIAAQLGIAKATVGTRILRTRLRLRDLLTRELGED